MAGLTLAALGVVYGDIGTSPLYALRECFHPSHGLAITAPSLLGVLSLILWSLIVVVSIKYLTFVLRAGNRGEGGILALLALAVPEQERNSRRYRWLVLLGIAGAALLYGDCALTPAVTILSAIEGLNAESAHFQPYVIPVTVTLLVLLFTVQRIGTGSVGKLFGPVMAIWFVTLAVLGVDGIRQAPEVLAAANPLHGLRFIFAHGTVAFVVMGSVFLAVTGAEALYADMGHFGAKPIRLAWFFLVMPSLMLNYLGQGALLLRDPAAIVNPFFSLAPAAGRFPLVLLAAAASVIASQALISGTFSITRQAIQLGLFPRLAVQHTSSAVRGQVYVPRVNRMLMLLCIALVLGFGTSSKLAAAYGMAVSLTMFITSVLFYAAARHIWKWSAWKAGGLTALFLLFEAVFCLSNLTKIWDGGWVPMVISGVAFILMTTWRRGRTVLREKLQQASLPLDLFLADLQIQSVARVSGTAVFLAGNPRGTPIALLHNLKHNKVLHRRNLLLTITTTESSHEDPVDRVQIEELGEGFYRLTGRYGFMDEPDILQLFELCRAQGLDLKLAETTFFLSVETIIPKRRGAMALWREQLFAVMSRNAQRATSFFRLPANRVVELGMQVEL